MIRNPQPNDAQGKRIADTKDACEALERVLLTLPSNRERALALTNLEQASMWATKAILEGSK